MSDNQFYDYLLKLNEYDRKIKYSNSIGLTVSELNERWKGYANEFNFQFKELQVDFNEKDSFQIKLDKNIIFLGNTIDDEEKFIKFITMIGSGDGTIQSGMNIISSIGILIASLNPNEDIGFRKGILERLGLLGKEIDIKNETVANDLSYVLKRSKELGVWFTVSRNQKDER
ncbi:hypothetical protein GLV94_02540 [Virgibacillus halodenitrificans]|uniref:Uncharacterized protein n=1 Tax=Virgibacillus halodenitrificans TaxID=1482 RepID=A0ABR7VKX7_VIRHA|nr:hypothetical protein [Virgibacillus halodenitrificans]MBD1222371.1 hypothetical protein [Virgibacillus halodenitrificans]MYL44512.1 hypothetical protein [Virgibacillus halodenitrificans]